MQALIRNPHGQVQFVNDYPDPRPGPDQVLLAVRLAGICGTDLQILQGYADFHGVLGHEFVAAVAKGPRELLGRRVVAEINCVCGRCDMCLSGLASHCRQRTVLGIHNHDGAFADLLVVPRRNVHVLPEAVPDDAALFVEPLAAALQIVKQCPIEPRNKVVVLGDGRLGLLAVQVLAAAGKKGNVVLVGKHPDKLLFAEKRGIQGVLLADLLLKPEWDVVIDCTGSPDGFAAAAALVRPRGRLVLKSTWTPAAPVDLSPLVVNEIQLIGSRCGPFPDAVNALAAGQVVTTGLITARYPLADGPAALQKARQPDQIKVVLEIRKT